MVLGFVRLPVTLSFSALQRAEIAEIMPVAAVIMSFIDGFSALQRAEIAEIAARLNRASDW